MHVTVWVGRVMPGEQEGRSALPPVSYMNLWKCTGSTKQQMTLTCTPGTGLGARVPSSVVSAEVGTQGNFFGLGHKEQWGGNAVSAITVPELPKLRPSLVLSF